MCVREGIVPEESHYRAWFLIPSRQTPRPYWVIAKLRSRVTADDPETWVDMWDFVVGGPRGDGLDFNLFLHGLGVITPVGGAAVVPVGRWFSLDVYLRRSPGADGRLLALVDGKPRFEVTGRPTAWSPFVSWMVGSITERSPGVTVYVDDVAVGPP